MRANKADREPTMVRMLASCYVQLKTLLFRARAQGS